MKKARRKIRDSKRTGTVSRAEVARAVKKINKRRALPKGSPKCAPRLRRIA